jgi:hypothetical protein
MEGFKTEKRSLRSNQLVLFIILREKRTFTDDIGKTVEQLINALETEIGHPKIISIGINEGNRAFTFPGLPNRSLLLREQPCAVLD